MKTIRADKDIIYIWANKTEFIYNKKDYPFLQNIIAHALPGRNIHIILYQPDNLKQFNVDLEKLKLNLSSANIKNIYIYQLKELFSDQPKQLDLVYNFFKNCKSLANSIDLIKIMVAANLKKLNLEQGLLADMDCIIPKNLSLHVMSLNVFPLLNRNTNFTKDHDGITDCYVENGFSFVLGENNPLFNEILNEVNIKSLDYFYTRPTDAVYTIYAEKLIRYFTKSSDKICQLSLMEQYKLFSNLPEEIKAELDNDLHKIQFDRGNSWNVNKKNGSKDIPLVFKAGYHPIYPELNALNELQHNILFNKLDRALPALKNLVEKGWNVNDEFAYINKLQQKENILYYLLERTSEATGKDLEIASDMIDFIIEKGLNLDDKLLSFFMQYYKSASTKDALNAYAKVFADKYNLDYSQLLIDIDHLAPSSHIISSNWIYSPHASKTAEVSNAGEIYSNLASSDQAFFKSAIENKGLGEENTLARSICP